MPIFPTAHILFLTIAFLFSSPVLVTKTPQTLVCTENLRAFMGIDAYLELIPLLHSHNPKRLLLLSMQSIPVF